MSVDLKDQDGTSNATTARPEDALLRAFASDFEWSGVERLPYKEEGSAPFKSISRQILFADPKLGCELRYFEMAAGGYSTLERHEHVHAVMILRGHGECMLGNAVRAVKPNDLISIPSFTWHQFKASAGEAFGFLCMVNAERDKPQLPTADELTALKADPRLSDFLKNYRA
jgi:quercetin dioxygenase-like cupin family protein